MLTLDVISSMPALIIGIIIVAVSVGLFVMRPNQPDKAGGVENAQQYQEQSDGTESVSLDELAAPIASGGQILDLSGSGLSKTPEYIFSRTTITQLDLSNNDLAGSLPAEVRQLQNIRVLNLADNNFTGVPAEIGQLNKLEILDLSNNQLTGLPYELGNLSSLQLLDLRGNQYSAQDLERIKKALPSSVEIRVD